MTLILAADLAHAAVGMDVVTGMENEAKLALKLTNLVPVYTGMDMVTL